MKQRDRDKREGNSVVDVNLPRAAVDFWSPVLVSRLPAVPSFLAL